MPFIVELLLNETAIDVNIITGQLDLVVATPGTVEWVQNLHWNESAEFIQEHRNWLTYNGILEGYTQVRRNFALYWVNRAGHMVPLDNPSGMDAILQRVTKYAD